MGLSVLGRERYGGQAELTADRFGDGSERNAFLRDGVVGLALSSALEREPEDPRGVEAVDGGPRIPPLSDIGGDAPFARDGGEHRHEAVSLPLAMHGSRISDNVRVYAAVRKRESRLLGGAREGGDHLWSVRFLRFLSRQVQEPIGHDDRTLRSGKHSAEDLDGRAIFGGQLSDAQQARLVWEDRVWGKFLGATHWVGAETT